MRTRNTPFLQTSFTSSATAWRLDARPWAYASAPSSARTLGARVYPGPETEIGWAPIQLSNVGWNSVVRHLDDGPVLHWHGDTFDLPVVCDLLASTKVCRNQAFRKGTNPPRLPVPSGSHAGWLRALAYRPRLRTVVATRCLPPADEDRHCEIRRRVTTPRPRDD